MAWAAQNPSMGERIRHTRRTSGRRGDGMEDKKNNAAAAENDVINLARKRRCIICLTKYVHKITLNRKLWVAAEHIGCARASFEVN